MRKWWSYTQCFFFLPSFFLSSEGCGFFFFFFLVIAGAGIGLEKTIPVIADYFFLSFSPIENELFMNYSNSLFLDAC
jgi:hypothetical protein